MSMYILVDKSARAISCIDIIYILNGTYMKICSSVAHPPNHNIGVDHPTVGRDTESHPPRRADIHCKRDRTHGSVEVPVNYICVSIPVVER